MSQTAIPYYFFRGGSSRGPFFLRSDLPEDPTSLSNVLVAALGSGHPLNIDGLGGGNAVTTKVAMLSSCTDGKSDVNYTFAQVSVLDGLVDYKPTCGNIMVAVGPAAIEMGLVEPVEGVTSVRIHAVNTGARVTSHVQTPNGTVNYDGSACVDGVPGTAAPITLDFEDIVGAATGKLLPTGNLRDTIDGIEVTCLDVAMPMVIARADAFGLEGQETQQALDENKAFFERMEKVRLKAGELMGMGDCSKSVTPKFGLVAPAKHGGSMATRYFMPWQAHPSLAVTGSQCLCACALTPGTVADGLVNTPKDATITMQLEHPMGMMDVVVTIDASGGSVDILSAGVVRTARKLARGELYIPASVWSP